MQMQDNFLPCKECEQKDGQLYHHTDIRHSMEMHYVVSPYFHQRLQICRHGIPQFCQLACLYLCPQSVASVFLPERHLLHQADDGGHTAAALLRRTYNKHFLHKLILYVTRISTVKHVFCHTVLSAQSAISARE